MESGTGSVHERPESLEPSVLELSGRDGDALLGSRCTACDRVFFPQRRRCAACAEETNELVRLPRTGTLTAVTGVRRQPPHAAVVAPYLLGEVTLAKGLRIYAVVDADPNDVRVGDDVELETTTVTTTDGRAVSAYIFRPTKASR